ncbi:MAG TPA: transposase, partial [Syntrophorhabdales bacterium]|nr:transposase [Syntrophorhabdales bacterium]
SLHAIFDGNLCRACMILDQCPVRAPNHRTKGCQAGDTNGDFRLEITPEIRLRDHMYAMQQTTEWKDRYRIRSGIEATNSELKRAHGIGRLRVRRIAKVCFAVACKVIACNIKRWAKAHTVLKGAPQGCLSSLYVRVKLWSDLVRVPLFKKQTFTTVVTI